MNDMYLTAIIKKHIHFSQFCMYIYGSSALNDLSGRDIDAVVTTQDVGQVTLMDINIPIEGQEKICNLYIIPESVFLNDLKVLDFGGYYAQKFALSFKRLLHKGDAIDPALVFWLFQYELFRFELGSNPDTPEALAAFTHFQIFQYCSTFGRPLSKYILNYPRRKALCEYLEKEIFDQIDPCKSQFNQVIEDNLIRNRWQSLYLFWNEYNRHKCNRQLWGRKTLSKLIMSFQLTDHSILLEYFGNLQTKIFKKTLV